MIYVKIKFTTTVYGSKAECPILDAHLPHARWFYVDADNPSIGYAGFLDDRIEVLNSSCVEMVEQAEAIAFKKAWEDAAMLRKQSMMEPGG